MNSEYKVHKTRWLFLATLALHNTICYLIGVSFSPVATLVTQYYKIDGDQIDILVEVGWGIHVVGMYNHNQNKPNIIQNMCEMSFNLSFKLHFYRNVYLNLFHW